MFYLKDKVSERYVVSIGPVKNYVRVIYFDDMPCGARWVTLKGAESALEKLRKAPSTNPPGVADSLAVVEIK